MTSARGRLRSLWNLIWVMADRSSAPIAVLTVLMSVLYGVCYVEFTDQLSTLQNAIINNDSDNRTSSLFLLLVVIALGALAAAIMLYTGDLLINVAWRYRLTEYIADRYFQARIAFRLSHIDKRIVDADQRIGSDAVLLCAQLKTVLIGTPMFLGAIPLLATTIAFCISLVKVIGWVAPVMGFALCFFFLSINYFLMRRPVESTKQNSNETGVYRFIHTYIRLQSESIALLGGHDRERRRCRSLIQSMSKQTSAVALFDVPLNTNSNLFYWGVSTAAAAIPYLATAIMNQPLIQDDFLASNNYLTQLLYQLATYALLSRDFSQLSALAVRIDELIVVLDDLIHNADLVTAIDDGKVSVIGEIAFDQVTLRTPTGRVLFPNGITFSVRGGGQQNVLIMGPNGIGKSSLFRALGDLWPIEAGVIRKPTDAGAIFFVPQRPFLSFGTLREQITYPGDESELDDKTAMALLETVRLTGRFEGGLDKVAMWSEVLSGGEQQRLGIARLLYHKPRFAILDESTSAMDELAEVHVYDLLTKSRIGLLSIGHRSTIRRFHHVVIEIDDQGGWAAIAAGTELGPSGHPFLKKDVEEQYPGKKF